MEGRGRIRRSDQGRFGAGGWSRAIYAVTEGAQRSMTHSAERKWTEPSRRQWRPWALVMRDRTGEVK